MRLSGGVSAALVVFMAASAGATGQEKDKEPRNPFEKRPLDSYGDPLPEHARSRLGTTRWRHVGPGPYRSEIGALAFSSDGNMLASLSNGSICVWDRGSGKLMREFGSAHFGKEPSLKFSTDGKRLAASGAAEHFWDIARSKPIASGLENPERSPEAIALSPNGKDYLIPVGGDVIKKRVPGGEEVRRFTHAKTVFSNVLFSADGAMVVAGGYTERRPTVVGWSDSSQKIIFRIESPPGHFDPQRMELSADGKVLATGGEALRLWSLPAGKELLKLPRCRAFAISSDNKIACLTRHEIVLYHLASGKEWLRVPEPLHYSSALAISPDGRTLALGHTRGFIRLVDLRVLVEAMPTTGHRGPILGLAFSPTGKWLVSASPDCCGFGTRATVKKSASCPAPSSVSTPWHYLPTATRSLSDTITSSSSWTPTVGGRRIGSPRP